MFLEDAGYDWKLLGPDVSDLDYVAWQADQDAYACSGQKCSAQSMLIMHTNWRKAGLLDELRARAATRKLSDLTIGPVLTWTTSAMLEHTRKLLALPGATARRDNGCQYLRVAALVGVCLASCALLPYLTCSTWRHVTHTGAELLWGGKPLQGHSIPECYGAIEPTAVFVPLATLSDPSAFALATTEVFGPFQVITQYDGALPAVWLNMAAHHSGRNWQLGAHALL